MKSLGKDPRSIRPARPIRLVRSVQPSRWFRRSREALGRSYLLLDTDSDTRRENRETDKFNHPAILTLAAAALVAVLATAADSLTPPRDIALRIREEPGSYLPFNRGRVSFQRSVEPPAARGTGHAITLPERNLAKLPGFDPDHIWYEFDIEIPNDKFALNRTGLLVPKIWGRAEVYVNGIAADFGLNQRPIIPLREARNRLQIHVAAENPFKFGIRATYPLVAGDIDRLRELERTLDAQAMTPIRLLIVQLVIGALFLGIFLVLPRKPELLTFVGYTLVNLAYGSLVIHRESGGVPFLSSWTSQEGLALGLDTARSYLLFRFSLEFFRLASNRIRAINRATLILVLPVVFATFLVFRRLAPSAAPWTLLHVAEQSYFLTCTVAVAAWVCGYLLFHLRHRSRAVLGLIVLAGIAYTFGANIVDFWFVQEKITGEYRNQLLTYFLMAAITTIEFARTERDKTELAGNLPREQREKFLRRVGRLKAVHEGFILLVDGVAFSALQEGVPPEEQGALSERVNSHLLGLAATIPGASVLNGTGDGFYFAWEGACTQELLEAIASLSSRIAAEPLETGHGELSFRCAVGYGPYFVGVSRSDGLMKDFSAGSLLTALARIAVSGPNAGGGGVRFLASGPLGAILKKSNGPGPLLPLVLEGKHGARFEVLELLPADGVRRPA